MNGRSHRAKRASSSPLEDRHTASEVHHALQLRGVGRHGFFDEYDSIGAAGALGLKGVSRRRAAYADELRVNREERFRAGDSASSAELRESLRPRQVGIEHPHDRNAGRPIGERVHASSGTGSADAGA